VTTLQAVPGAGYPGVASLDILGSVAPYISGEEEKIEQEVTKLLGVPQDSRIVGAPIVVSAHANRVPVGHGHTVCLTVGFDQPVTPEAALEVLRAWRGEGACEGLPSRANGAPLVVRAEEDRPQARRDVYAGGG